MMSPPLEIGLFYVLTQVRTLKNCGFLLLASLAEKPGASSSQWS